MPKRSDVRTLKNLIDEAYLVASSNPLPKGGIESLRENLDAARRLARLLLVRPGPESAAAELGKLGGKKTAERGPDYYAEISAMRKERKGGRPAKYQDVLTSGASPSSVRSRAAFVIAGRVKELGMSNGDVAKAIHASEQYVYNLMQGVTIPSDEKIQALIKALKLDDLQTDQLRTYAKEDRRKNDGRFQKRNI